MTTQELENLRERITWDLRTIVKETGDDLAQVALEAVYKISFDRSDY